MRQQRRAPLDITMPGCVTTRWGLSGVCNYEITRWPPTSHSSFLHPYYHGPWWSVRNDNHIFPLCHQCLWITWLINISHLPMIPTGYGGINHWFNSSLLQWMLLEAMLKAPGFYHRAFTKLPLPRPHWYTLPSIIVKLWHWWHQYTEGLWDQWRTGY